LNIPKCSQLRIIDPGGRGTGHSIHDTQGLFVDAQQLPVDLAAEEVSVTTVDPGPNLVLLWFAFRKLPSAEAVLLHVESEVGLLCVGTVVLDEEGGRCSAVVIPQKLRSGGGGGGGEEDQGDR
jgi:hypothetical protein